MNQAELLQPASNKATWKVDYELVDDETDELIDMSNVTEITVGVRDPRSKTSRLQGSLTGGEVAVTDTGTLRWTFTADQMGGLCPQTYEVGLTLEQDDETVQLLIGHLPVLDGIVA